MPGHSGRLWHGSSVNPDSPDVLVLAYHCGKVCRVPCPPPPQRVLQSDTGKTPLVHNFQHCFGHRNVPLGDGGSRGGGIPKGHRAVDTESGGIFIFQQWPDCLNMGGTATKIL